MGLRSELDKMVGQRGFTRKPWRAGFSPREALASLALSGTKVPRGLKSALQNRRGAQRFVWLVGQALACDWSLYILGVYWTGPV